MSTKDLCFKAMDDDAQLLRELSTLFPYHQLTVVDHLPSQLFHPELGVWFSPFASIGDAIHLIRKLDVQRFKIRVGEDRNGWYGYAKLGEDRAVRQCVPHEALASTALRWAIVRASVQHFQSRNVK